MSIYTQLYSQSGGGGGARGDPFLMMYLWWSLCTLYLFVCQVSYYKQLRSLLLLLCDVF